jgi:hypothetical protein
MSKQRSVSHLQLSILLSISLFFITLTFKSYFYYLPFSQGVSLLAILQFLTLPGWVLLIAVPPLAFASEYKWTQSKYVFFLVSVSLWTLSTLAIKIYTLATFGQVPYQYLVTFPILFYFEWIVPALYVYLALTYYKPASMVKQKRATNRVLFDDEPEPVSNLETQVRQRERFDD